MQEPFRSYRTFSRPRLYTCADFAVLYYPEISCKSLPTSTTNNIRKERKKKEESKSFVVVDDGVLIFLETDYVSFQKMSSSSPTMSTGVSSKPVIYPENYHFIKHGSGPLFQHRIIIGRCVDAR
jgi:hypothetical protein